MVLQLNLDKLFFLSKKNDKFILKFKDQSGKLKSVEQLGGKIIPLENNQGNITAELGLAYDMSDYLNDTWKTSYIKSAFTWDTQLFNFETKLELEYFSQISDIVDSDLTRFQALGEVQYALSKSIYLFVSFIQELSFVFN